MSTRAQLSETLNRLLPGEQWKRVREGILAAASYSGQRTDQLRQNIDEANRLKTGLLVNGTVEFTSTTNADLSGYAWVIDYMIQQQTATESVTVDAPDANFPRPDILVGLADGSIDYRAGTIDAAGNALEPSYNPATEVLLASYIRNPNGTNEEEGVNAGGQSYVSKTATGTEVMQGSLALAKEADVNQVINYAAFDRNGKLVKKSTGSAFNKNFGTAAGTVAQGNDSRIINGQTAFSWGNHGNAGYAVLGTGTGQVRSNSQLDARYAAIAHTHQISEVNGLQASLDAKANLFLKGAANGLAELDGNGKVPLSQINDSLLGQVEYMGTWNPATNVPALPTVPTEKGHYYVASAAGSRFGLSFQTGDWLISNGSSWEKVDNTDAVTSVFGRTGAVGAQVGDYASFYPRLDTVYSNPAWVGSLAWSKLTGVPTSFTPAAHTHAISEVSGLQTALDNKEAAFGKNTAFNKNFGTAAGTVAQGNDSRINNGQTAFGWGNHANAGYITQSLSDSRYLRYVGAVSDLNNVGTAAFVPVSFTSSFQPGNRPSDGANYFSGLQFRHNLSQDFRTQLLTNTAGGNPKFYIRTMIDGVWGSYREFWHNGNLSDPLNLTNGNAILPLNRYFGSGTGNGDAYMQPDANGAMNFNVASGELYRYYRGGTLLATINGAGITSQGGVQTKFPNASTLGPIWRLGGKFAGSASVDHVLRVQVGNDIFDIPAELVETIIV